MIDFEKSQQIAHRMSQSTTGQESAEWLLAALLIKWATESKLSLVQHRQNGNGQPKKTVVELREYDR